MVSPNEVLQGREEADRRIEEAHRTGARVLDLSSLELVRLPDTIAHLTDLTELDVSNNLLTELPEEIGQLANLTKLRVSGNPLAVPLPPE